MKKKKKSPEMAGGNKVTSKEQIIPESHMKRSATLHKHTHNVL